LRTNPHRIRKIRAWCTVIEQDLFNGHHDA
jgi:hypothetical protein